MKKLLLTIMIFACVFNAACFVKKTDDVEVVTRVNFQEWEDYFDMFNCYFTYFYGKVNLVEKNVIQGKKCAELCVQRNMSIYKPTLKIDAVNAEYGYDFSDFSAIDYVCFSIFNANESENAITFSVKDGSDNDIITESYRLKPNVWTNVRYAVNRMEVNALNESAQYFLFELECITGTWYLDDFYVEKAVDEAEKINADFSGDVLLNFDKSSDMYYVAGISKGALSAYVSRVEQSTHNGITVGKSSLKLVFEKMFDYSYDDLHQVAEHYSGFTFGKSFIDAVDFSRLSRDNFSIDVYSCASESQNIVINVKDEAGHEYKKRVEVTPSKWQKLTFSAEELSTSGVMINRIVSVCYFVDQEGLRGNTVFYFDNAGWVKK